jgi:hypothetical protein
VRPCQSQNQCDQNDDRNGYAKQEQEDGTHDVLRKIEGRI